MTLNIARLESIGNKVQIPRRDSWRPPVMADLVQHEGTMFLAADQSLSAAGLAVIYVGVDHLSILWSATLRGVASEDAEGYEETLQKALSLSNQLAEELGKVPAGVKELVHEGVPIGGGKIVRPESSLMASLALRREAAAWDIAAKPMVQPQSHRRVICGNPKASKKEEHEALIKLVPALPIIGYELITNEATRDALCVGIAHLVRNEG